MFKPWLGCLLLIIASASRSAHAETAVSIISEPRHHLVLENDYARVFKVDVPPHTSTLMHQHEHAYVYVVLGPAEIENEVQGKPPAKKIRFVDGETNLLDGGFAHRVRNLAETPFRNITIEILRKPPPSAERELQGRGLSVDSGFAIDTMFDTDAVRVSEIKLMPGATLPRHKHSLPHLAVAISDLDLRNVVQGASAKRVHQKAGDFTWLKARVSHSITNVGTEPARWVSVEFK